MKIAQYSVTLIFQDIGIENNKSLAHDKQDKKFKYVQSTTVLC